MSKPTHRVTPLDYASVEPGSVPIFRWGVLSLFLSILSGVVGAVALMGEWMNLYRGESIFVAALILSVAGFAAGIGGWLQPEGKGAANLGMVLSIIDWMLISILVPA